MKTVSLHFFLVLVVIATGGAFTSATSASLYKWVDEYGNVTYQDTPPPANVEFEESELAGPSPTLADTVEGRMEAAAVASPVSLYTVPECDGCDLVRLYLERNSVPFAEINVRNNIPGQGELEQKTGSLEVPTLIIGEKILGGYSKSSIKAALMDAGFPLDQVAEAATSADDPDQQDDQQTDLDTTETETTPIPGLDQTATTEP